jgi:hypothetical protein
MMSWEAIKKMVKQLEARMPHKFCTYDADNNVVIASDLGALEFVEYAGELWRSGDEQGKAELRDKLRRSVRSEGGGRLHELLLVQFEGPVDVPKTWLETGPENSGNKGANGES